MDFIVRFTEGTDGITGISHEPWHLRYVGKKVAKEIKDQKLDVRRVLSYIKTLFQNLRKIKNLEFSLDFYIEYIMKTLITTLNSKFIHKSLALKTYFM